MADAPTNRLRTVLRLAKRNEESAQRDAMLANRRSREADQDAEHSSSRLAELESESPTTAHGFKRQRQRAVLRADQAKLADDQVREMLNAELEARDVLRGAVRRRRSLEKLDGRRLATQAGLAAHAAQRALDELATMRRKREPEDDR